MATLEIHDAELTSLKDKVIVVTGGSSGIGLASTELFLSLGAKVVVGDVNACPLSSPEILYQQVDVSDWKSQLELFKRAVEKFGKIDHVFANAGMTSVATYLEERFDDKGDLLPPTARTTDVNLTGVIYTCKLGIHYLKKNPSGGSVLITGSGASFTPFPLTDYNVAKHGVLGLMRGLAANLTQDPTNKIRINMLAPFWTITGLVTATDYTDLGMVGQSADVVARSAALLMADNTRMAQVIRSRRGEYREIESELLKSAVAAFALEEQDAPKHSLSKLMLDEMLKRRNQGQL